MIRTVNDALRRLIAGELPLDEWVALVRTTVPPPARWRQRRREQPGGGWRTAWERVRAWFCGPPPRDMVE